MKNQTKLTIAIIALISTFAVNASAYWTANGVTMTRAQAVEYALNNGSKVIQCQKGRTSKKTGIKKADKCITVTIHSKSEVQ